MSDPLQVVPTAVAVPRVTPVRPEPPVEPAKKAPTENRSSNDYRQSERQAEAETQRQMAVSRDEQLKRFIYRSIEAENGDVVWQYPAQEILRVAKNIRMIEERRLAQVEARTVDEKA